MSATPRRSFCIRPAPPTSNSRPRISRPPGSVRSDSCVGRHRGRSRHHRRPQYRTEDQPAIGTKRAMDITLDTKTVRYANGGCEHDPALPGVVLVHGAGMNRTVFQLQTRYLAHHGYRVAAIDLPGHGGSEGPAIETVPEMGAWLADVIVALDMGPAHVIGHSMGTFIGIEAAAQRPESGVTRPHRNGSRNAGSPRTLDAAANDVRRVESDVVVSFGAPAHIGRHATPGMWNIGAMPCSTRACGFARDRHGGMQCLRHLARCSRCRLLPRDLHPRGDGQDDPAQAGRRSDAATAGATVVTSPASATVSRLPMPLVGRWSCLQVGQGRVVAGFRPAPPVDGSAGRRWPPSPWRRGVVDLDLDPTRTELINQTRSTSRRSS